MTKAKAKTATRPATATAEKRPADPPELIARRAEEVRKMRADGKAATEAGRTGVLNKERQVARIFGEEELDALLAKAATGGFALGKAAVIELITLAKRSDRSRFAALAIRHRWSCEELKQAIRRERGTRRNAGRRRKVADDPVGLLAQLEVDCERFRRLGTIVAGKPGVLPPKVSRLLRSATAAVAELQAATEAALGRRVPGMSRRSEHRADEDDGKPRR